MRRKGEYFALEIDSSDEDLMGSVPFFFEKEALNTSLTNIGILKRNVVLLKIVMT